MVNIIKKRDFRTTFTEKYGRGTVIEINITAIISPSQIITDFNEGFIGRMSLIDISWCFPEAEEKFSQFKVGQRITCVVIDIDFENKQIQLNQKYLCKQISDSIAWKRIERGDGFNGHIVESLNNSFLIKIENGFYGLLHKTLVEDTMADLKVKVSSKLDYCGLLSLVPASLEIENELSREDLQTNKFSFIEEELQSFRKFKRSLLGINATDKVCEIIEKGFEIDEKIFSKEISTKHTLYIQFELNSSVYELTFRQQAIPYYIEGGIYNEKNEKIILDKFSSHSYWFRLNKRKRTNRDKSQEEDFIEFSLYNEQINFYGEVQVSKDQKEHRFVIKNFSFDNTKKYDTSKKKWDSKNGSFLFSNQLKVLSPLMTLPFDNSHKIILDLALIKTECFEIINQLKLNAGEILRQEGRTLAIIDKFLEYQMSLIDEQKENNVFVEKFKQVSGVGNEIVIKLEADIANSIELADAEETIVNIRLKIDDIIVRFTDGSLKNYQDSCLLSFNPKRPISISQLENGFYLDRRISKSQFQIQREIIQDFLEKKIKIDHIESLLVHPEKIKTPVLSSITFHNSDLERTEKENPDNNQVKAVKKSVGNQNIFLIQGPPGTGKTTVIAEIIEQLVMKGKKILVSGQNHVAVDNVLEKMSKVHNLNLLRVGNPERIDKELVRYSIDNLVEEYKVDYNTFINNQLFLAKKYQELRNAGFEGETFVNNFNRQVNELSSNYCKLREIYKERHFILRDGLSELQPGEINEAIVSLENWINSNNNEYEILLKPIIYNSVDVVFATCIGIKTDQIFRDSKFKFDTVIIDEAGKANIAETLVAIELGKKVILVGDQMQLPPYIDTSLIDERDPKSFPKSQFGSDFLQDEIIHALKTSFFEFIINRIEAGQFPEDNKEMLNYQHRMHPNIGKFVSESFYNGMVQMGSRTILNRIDMPTPFNKEVIFFDTSNSNNPYEQNDGYSARNNTEAEAITEIILPRLFESNISPNNIAIIAPYKSQVANIQHYIRNSTSCNFKNIDVSTLDSFQGKEYDIIVFSFTRSANFNKPEYIDGKRKSTRVGFLDDARRLNVAFSRAKKKLILVGNSVTLTDSRSHYDGLFDYTQLFTNLVKLCKKEEIGNFVNIADLHDFKSPFEAFIEKYKVYDTFNLKWSKVGEKCNKIFGLFFKIEKVDCLLPISCMPEELKIKLNVIDPEEEILVAIHKIDTVNKKVTLIVPSELERINKRVKNLKNTETKATCLKQKVNRVESWQSSNSKLSVGQEINGIIKYVTASGYFVQLDNGAKGLLPNFNIKDGHNFKSNDPVLVVITELDENNQQIILGL